MPNDEWRTPPNILEAARDVMGGIHFDPYSSKRANKFVKATHYNTLEDPLTWWSTHKVWCNPPYSRGNIGPAVQGFIEHVEEGIILLNADTRTEWFKSLSRDCDARLFTGALAFIDPETGKPKAGNRIGQVLFYRGMKPSTFYLRFVKEGCFE